MKSINIFVAIFSVVLVSAGCKKVLDTEPNNAFSDVSAFTTTERINLALNGVYDAAQSGFYINTDNSNTVRGYPFGAANIEQGDARGEDVINVAAFFQVTYQNGYTPTSPNNVNIWSNLYFLINKANIFIQGVQDAASKGVITEAKAKEYEGQARFLRAMAHHELVINFARPYRDGNGNQLGVPYRDFAIDKPSRVEEARLVGRHKVSEVYQKILADLDFAETNLPATANVIRATKGAAVALKMRVKLHMGDWAGVITEGNKLVSASAPFKSAIGPYELYPSPDGVFATNDNAVESMFSIKNDALDNPGTNGALPSMYGSVNNKGRGLMAISPIIYNNPGWKCDDKRKTLLYTSGTNANNTTNIFTTKYRIYVDRADYAPQIRYAEVLLSLAEAEARQDGGVSSKALSLLNAVRNRALNAPATEAYTAASFANKTELTAAILLERRIEFLAEGKRWGDIHRNAVDPDFSTGGIPAKMANGAAGTSLYGCSVAASATQVAVPYSDFKFIWPIPAEEISQNPIIEQNPKY